MGERGDYRGERGKGISFESLKTFLYDV